jgi:hypothetical protein
MATITYWSTLFLCLFFINTNQISHTMKSESTQDLTQTTKTIVQSIKAIQKHCKDNNINLQTSLTPKEYQQFQADVALVKKYMPEIKADIWATKQEAEKDVDPKDISEPAFVDAVLQWRKKLLEDFLKTKNNYADVVIETSKFSKNINSNSSALPLNEALYKEWAALIDKIPSPSTGAVIFDALINSNGETWTIAGDKSALMTHYRIRANKKVYKEYENNIASFKNETLPQIALFLAAIKASTSADDVNLPNNKTATAKTDEEKAEAKANFEKQFNDNQNLEIKNIQSAEAQGDKNDLNTAAISLDKLIANQKLVSCIGFASELSYQVQQTIIKGIKSSDGMLSLSDAKILTVKTILESTDKKTMNALFEKYQNSDYTNAAYPTGFATWLNKSSESADFGSFSTAYDAWINSVDNCIQVFENELLKDKSKPSIKVVPKLFDKSIKAIFNKPATGLNSAPAQMVYEEFSAQLKSEIGNRSISIAKLDDIWQNSMTACKKETFKQSIYLNAFINKANSLSLVADAVSKIEDIFPKDSAIINALYDSRYIAAPMPVPTSKRGLYARFELNKPGRSSQTLDLLFHIPLRFVVKKDKKGKELYVPIPDAQKDLTKQDSSSYKVSLDDIFVEKTTYTSNDDLEARTLVTWKLTVEDTSSERVIQEKMNAVVNYLDCNLGDMLTKGAMSKAFGKDSMLGGNFLAAKVKLVGNDYGGLKEIIGEVTILGMTFQAGWGENGGILKFKNPLAVQKEERQYTYGSGTFHLYLSCNVSSDFRTDHFNVATNNGVIGAQNGAFSTTNVQLKEFIGTPTTFSVSVDKIEKK